MLLRYNSTFAVFKRFHKSRFSNGSVDNSINVLIENDWATLLISTRRADLLVCMPALGDRINMGFDEIDKTSQFYIMF